MEIRVTVRRDGDVKIESISALEDLWHDFQFFQEKGNELEHIGTPNDALLAKRYRRAALLALVFYFEGVLNRWLQCVLSVAEWRRVERWPLTSKIDTIHSRLPRGHITKPNIGAARLLRNNLAHLKPGVDGNVYDGISGEILEETASSITAWLSAIETELNLERHPDTRSESQTLRDALGATRPNSEGYTGRD